MNPTNPADPAVYPQSFAQRRLWFLDELDPGSPLYNVPTAVRVTGALDLDALRAALDLLVRRHPSLRTTFGERDGEAVQLVAERGSAHLEVVEAADARAALEAEARRPFDLATGPLLRTLVVREAHDRHHVLLTAHHIITDGWSQAILFDELGTAYSALVRGERPELPALATTYAEYTVEQHEELAGPLGEMSLEYWVDALRGAPELLTLPTDRPRPAKQSSRGAVHTRTLPAAGVLAALPVLGGTLFMVALAAYQAVLARHSGQDDVVVGTAVAGRTTPQTEAVVGLFVNTIPLRTSLAGNPTFRELLARVRDVALDGMSCADVPLERIVAEVRPARGQGHAPVFQVGLTVSTTPPVRLSLAGAEVSEPEFVMSGTAKMDLTTAVVEDGDELRVDVEYNTDLFDEGTVATLTDRFARFLTAVTADPDTRILDVDLGTDAERAWQGGGETDPAPLVLGLVAGHDPAAVAVVDGDRTLTRGELIGRANALAWQLREHGVGPETLVALGHRLGVEAIIGVLGCHLAGGAYLPLDPDHPADRLAALLADARPAVLVTDRPDAFAGFRGPVVAVPEDTRDTPPPTELRRDTLAYVIYTSGSSGAPKGVMVEHGTLANLTRAFADAHPFGPADRVLVVPPLVFDASVGDLFPALARGSTLVVCHDPAALSGGDLIRLCAEQGITMVDTAAPLWRKWTDDLEATGVPCASPLRVMMVGGDAVATDAARRWTAMTGATLVNHYGPTEATVCATLHTATGAETGPQLPIGRPLPHVRAHVLDADGRPALAGVPGELCLGGDALARGYLGRPDLTAEAFVTDASGARVYRTGDLARWRPDGTLEFLGRVDRQVKVRGHRVEPAEIEAACRAHPDVADALVVARPDDSGEQRLVGYLVPHSPADLRAFLRRSLPEYLVPTDLVGLAELPVTANGKLDHAALPAPRRETVAHVAASGPTARALATEWAALLGVDVDGIGEETDFFDLGGHSLLAARMITRIRLALGVDVPLRAVFDAPTLGGLAAAIDTAAPATALDLRAEAVLPADLVPAVVDGAVERACAPRSVLVTGATGFLGGYLLADTLTHTDATAHCLVRATSPADGLARIERGLRGYGLWRPEWAERVVALPGDLGAPRFGLAEDAFSALAEEVDLIHHCGGIVHFAQSYAELKAANVTGTEWVLRLAAGRGVPVHFVSTLGVYPLHRAGVVTEALPPEEPEHLDRGYEQSKWVADALVRAARDAGLPVTVHRPARVTGDSRTGAAPGEDMFCKELRTFAVLGAAPESDVLEDMAPVDFVAAAIGLLSRSPGAHGGDHHYFGRTIHASRIAEALRDQGHPIRELPHHRWYSELLAVAAESGDPALSAIAAASGPEPDVRVREFDCSATDALLAAAGLVRPAVDAAMLRRYLDHYVRVGGLPAPAPLAVAHER